MYLFEAYVKALGLEIQWWLDEKEEIVEINILERARSFKRKDGSRYSRGKDRVIRLWSK